MRVLVCCQPAIAQWPELLDKIEEVLGKLGVQEGDHLRVGLLYPTEISISAHFAGSPLIGFTVELCPKNVRLDQEFPPRQKAMWWHTLSSNLSRLYLWDERSDPKVPYVDWLIRNVDALLVIREKQDTEFCRMFVDVILALGLPVVTLDPVSLRAARLRP